MNSWRAGAIDMSTISQKRIRLAYIAAAYLMFAFVVIRAPIVPQGSASDPLFSTALAVFVTMACVADSAVLKRPIAFEVRMPFAVTWPASLPIYLLRSRGWWGGAVLLALLGSLIVLSIACATIGVAATLLMK
jgi:hypothetical protein